MLTKSHALNEDHRDQPTPDHASCPSVAHAIVECCSEGREQAEDCEGNAKACLMPTSSAVLCL